MSHSLRRRRASSLAASSLSFCCLITWSTISVYLLRALALHMTHWKLGHWHTVQQATAASMKQLECCFISVYLTANDSNHDDDRTSLVNKA